MKRKHDIPDGVIDVLREIGMTPREAGWDCHGTYVLLHKALEKVAAKRNVVFDEPKILSADVTSKEAVVLCVGRIGEKMEWSIGEAAPYNNKNSYPFAMAEKRAIDRVILKLLGVHGDFYSQAEKDEADNPIKDTSDKPDPKMVAMIKEIFLTFLDAQKTREDLVAFWKNNPEPLRQLRAMSEVARQEVEDAFKERAKEIKQGES